MNCTFLVVAKAPVPGRAKTRLTPPFSDHQAAALAAASLLDSLDAVALAHQYNPAPAPRPVVALAGDLDKAVAAVAIRSALAGFRVVPQRGHGLAERLGTAHCDAAPSLGPIVQIGMDTPQVTPELLLAAQAALVDPDGPDAVLGPAEDGGWWALGLRRAADARLIADVAMSTPHTGRETLAALRTEGRDVTLLPVLRDVDRVEDVVAVANLVPGTRFARLASALLPIVTQGVSA